MSFLTLKNPLKNQRRFLLFAINFGVLFSISLLWLFGTTMSNPMVHPDARLFHYGGDFLQFWAAPQIAEKDAWMLYRAPLYEAAQQALYPGGVINDNGCPYPYPPHSLILFAPFAALPYLWALASFMVLGIALYLYVGRVALGEKSNWLALGCLLISPFSAVEWMGLQNGYFTAAAGMSALLFLEQGRRIGAGIIVGMMSVKPQLFLLFPVILLITRDWRTIAVACATLLWLVTLSVLFYGTDIWNDYYISLTHSQWHYASYSPNSLNGYMRMFDYMVMSPLSALRQFGVSKLAASVLQCVLSLVVIALIIAVWSRPLLRWQRVMLMASGGLLATPYALNYDMGFLTLAIVLYWTSVHETTQHLKIDRIFLAYLAPVLCIYLAIFLRPLTPLIILAVFWRTYKSCAKRIAIPNYLRPESA